MGMGEEARCFGGLDKLAMRLERTKPKKECISSERMLRFYLTKRLVSGMFGYF